jgi:hypothetical protein
MGESNSDDSCERNNTAVCLVSLGVRTVPPQLVSNVMAMCPTERDERSHRVPALYLIAVGGGGEGGGDPSDECRGNWFE